LSFLQAGSVLIVHNTLQPTLTHTYFSFAYHHKHISLLQHTAQLIHVPTFVTVSDVVSIAGIETLVNCVLCSLLQYLYFKWYRFKAHKTCTSLNPGNDSVKI